MNLKVKEIFYSLQGEGGRQCEASIFVRLAGCNLNCEFCDTDFDGGQEMSTEQILLEISQYPCQWIVWTGGEPTLQITDECLLFFKQAGYLQAIESNGHTPLSSLLDYTVVSPKKTILYAKINNPEVDEIRLPVSKDDLLPDLEFLPKAIHYFISPVFSADKDATNANISWCVEQIKQNTKWRLSLQIHKLIGIE